MGPHNIVLRQNNRSETPPTTDDANKFNIITFPRSANALPFCWHDRSTEKPGLKFSQP
jgi:hypothetical protein